MVYVVVCLFVGLFLCLFCDYVVCIASVEIRLGRAYIDVNEVQVASMYFYMLQILCIGGLRKDCSLVMLSI